MLGNILGAIAGPLIGGLLGSKGGGGQQQTATKEPWAEAAPWLKNQIAQGQQLQDYYQKNPFNAQQQTGYQNTFGDLDNFRANTAPGLMQFANNAMTGSYQRQTGGAPGSGGGYGGAVRPGGLLQNGQGAFSTPRGGLFGQIDFNATNPFTNGHMSQMEAKRLADADLEAKRLASLQAQQIQQGYGNDYGSAGA